MLTLLLQNHIILSTILNSRLANSINYGETANVDITLKNVGPDVANNVTATVTTDDEYVVSFINNIDIPFGNIAGDNGTATSSESFSLTVSDTVPDDYSISFEVVSEDENDSIWNSTFSIIANAPVMEIGEMTIANDDNSNGRLDPGESADLIFETSNIGNATCNNPVATLAGDCAYFTINNETITLDPIDADSTAEVVFNVTAHAACSQGMLVNLTYTLTDAKSVVSTEELTIGQPPEITIGTGTATASNYPFYTYYENNKSQMLYLGSEIGAGEMNIQEIALDFTTIGGEATINNLVINFKQTGLTQLGSDYPDMTGATTVFSESVYTMPTATGWHVFDIADYTMNMSDSNLIVEIIWGDNGSWSSAFEVNSTDAGTTMVTYGYSDSETPPAYDGNSTVRPNMMMMFEGEVVGDIRTVTFTVEDDQTSAPIEDAAVMVGSLVKKTNVSGEVVFNLLDADYTYTADHETYSPSTQIFTVDEDENITIALSGDAGVASILPSDFKIYPIPANDYVNIESNFLITKYELFDPTGNYILGNLVKSNKFTIELGNVKTGTYFMRIVTYKGETMLSIIVIR